MNLGSILKLVFDLAVLTLAGVALWLYFRERKKVQLLRDLDPLTGAMTLQRFSAILGMEINRTQRTGRTFCLAHLDLNAFRLLNQQFGTSAGNEALRLAVELVQTKIRRLDAIARLGGDEFILLLPESDKPAGITVMQRVQQGFFEAMAARAWPVGMSIGLAVFKTAPASVDEALGLAAELARAAKAKGKNTLHSQDYQKTEA